MAGAIGATCRHTVILAGRRKSQLSDQRWITSIDDGESHTSRTHPLQTPNGVSAPIMKISTLLFFTLASITGCSMTHGDPTHPKKNPHPVKRYEVTATADAPGPWDSVKGVVFFDVVNRSCVPRGSFTGGQNVPNTSINFEMTRVGDKTWKGYFYRDALQNEDYFGLGVCHWDVTQASPVFSTHGESFVPGSGIANTNSYTEYFKKSDFLNESQKDGGYGTTSDDPELAKYPDAFFPITATVKEVMP